MEANKAATPSVTSVSISLSRKEQGALYMKSLRQAERIKELKEANAELAKALQEMVEIAKKVDGWESFPSDPIEKAEDALIKAAGSAA